MKKTSQYISSRQTIQDIASPAGAVFLVAAKAALVGVSSALREPPAPPLLVRAEVANFLTYVEYDPFVAGSNSSPEFNSASKSMSSTVTILAKL